MAWSIQHRRLKAENGERFSLLLEGDPAVPLFYPTVYTVEHRRSRGLAASTTWNDEVALAHLLVWAHNSDIDLDARFEQGQFLTEYEIASYARAAKQKHCNLVGWRIDNQHTTSANTALIKGGRESFRTPNQSAEPSVGLGFEDRRLRVARQYLGWLADKTAPRASASVSVLTARDSGKNSMLQKMRSYEPGTPGRSGHSKIGLTQEQQTLLQDVIRPDSPRNPWKTPYVRARNQVLISFLLGLGSRRGEAQKQYVSHIDMHRQQVSIVRNPDAIDDDRRVEPNVKRVGRILPMNSSLSDILGDYIIEWRSNVPGSEKTDYLFLTIAGKPMSTEAVDKVFRTLRKAIKELPHNLSAHLLRHTWNAARVKVVVASFM